MTLTEALSASRLLAARGFDANGVCVVSVADYGGTILWMEGWDGNWTNVWTEIAADRRSKLDALDFRPTGPPPEIDVEVVREVFSYLDGDDGVEHAAEENE